MRSTPAPSAVLRLLALTAALILAPALHAQGLSYDMTTTATGVDPRGGAATTRQMMTAHGQFSNGASRIDFTGSLAPRGPMSAGTYIISNQSKGTTIMVDPAKHQYIEFDPAELAKSAAGLQQVMGAIGGIAKMEITDVNVRVEDLGAGEIMEGYATQKYRLTESYTSKVTVLGRTNASATRETSEFWIAPQLDGSMNPMAARPTAAAATGPTAELQAQIAAAFAHVRKGLMLRTVMTRESERGGKTVPSTMTMTVSNLRRAAISPGVFEVPAGYTKAASPMDALGPLGAIGDSLNAARARAGTAHAGNGGVSTAGEAVDSAKAGAKQGVVEGAKDEAKTKARNAIGRLFGRPQR